MVCAVSAELLIISTLVQRETTIVWDKVTGEPLYNAILWLDTRTQSTVDQILARLPRDANSVNYLQVIFTGCLGVSSARNQTKL